MKLYIPTTALNIDNLTATESVSAPQLYAKRDFGYQSFYTEPLRENLPIVLFSEIPYFELPKTEVTHSPMVVEVEVDDLSLKNLQEVIIEGVGCKLYYCGTSIVLTPYNTRFLFFSDWDRKQARLSCSDSAKNKMTQYYKFEVCHPNPQINLSQILPHLRCEQIEQLSPDNESNKIKGFILGFYIGCLRSLPNDVAEMRRLSKRVYDVITSSSGNNFRLSPELESKIQSLEKEMLEYDPESKKASQIWNEIMCRGFACVGHTISADKIWEALQRCKYGVYDAVKKTLIENTGLSFSRKLYSESYSVIEYRESLMAYVSKLMKKEQSQNKGKTDLNAALTHSSEDKTVLLSNVEDSANNKLYNELLVDLFWNQEFEVAITVDNLKNQRADIATNVATILRDKWESLNLGKWVNSAEQAYLHKLRLNISNMDPFDVKEIDNPVLQALAAFLLKGESFENLCTYLENNSFTRYDYALGFWGAMTGYVRIDRTIFDEFVDATEYYPAMCNLLQTPTFGMPLTDHSALEKYDNFQYNDIPSSLNTRKECNDDDFSKEVQVISFNTKVFLPLFEALCDNKSKAAKEFVGNIENQKVVTEDSIWSEYNDIKAKQKGKTPQRFKHTIATAIEAYRRRHDHISLEELLKAEGVKSKKLKDILAQVGSYQKVCKGRVEEPTLFPEVTNIVEKTEEQTWQSSINNVPLHIENKQLIELHFEDLREWLKNEGIWDKCSPQIQKSFKYIIKGYKPREYYYENYEKYPRNNVSVINHFENWCFSSKNKYSKCTEEDRPNVKQLVSILQKRFK